MNFIKTLFFFLSSSSLITQTLGINNCYTPFDVSQQALTSYEGSVYDFTEYYYHPAGRDILIQAFGKPLEPFFDQPIYAFHKNSKQTFIDLAELKVGILQNDCTDFSSNPSFPNSFTFFHKNFLNFTWWFENQNELSINANILRYDKEQYFGLSLIDNNIVIGWNNKTDNTDIDVYYYSSLTTNQDWTSFFTNKPNKETYFIRSNVILTSTTFALNFTIPTISPEKLKQVLVKYIVGNYFDPFTQNISDISYRDGFYINLVTGLPVNPNKNYEPYENYLLKEFKEHMASILSYIVFFFIFLGCLILTHTKKYNFFNNYVKVPVFGFISKGTFIFSILYLIWYFAFLIYSLLNLQEILFRTGTWISLILAINLLPITRNSLWVILFNLSYERLNQFHRLIGFTAYIAVLIKFFAVFFVHNQEFLISTYYLDNINPLAGTIATILIVLTTFLSLSFVRTNYFEVFFFSHRIFCLLIIIASSIHHINFLYYLLPSIVLYAIDLLVRHFKTHKAIYSKIKVVGDETNDTCCIIITVTLVKNIDCKPGSYFFLCFENISKFEYHPLSLISHDEGTLIFCAKDMGEKTWTNKLKKFNTIETLFNRTIYIQGPYGHFDIKYEEDKYENLILVAGGIGIPPVLSVMEDINTLFEKQKLKKLKKCILIWVVHHHSFITPFNKTFLKFDENLFEFHLFSTNKFQNEPNQILFPFHVTIKRPHLPSLLNQLIIDNYGSSSNTAVFSCGPHSLSKDVIETCVRLNITISTEYF